MQITYGQVSDTSLSPDEILSHILKQRGIIDIKTFLQPEDPTSFSLTALGFEKELHTLFDLLTNIKKEKKTVVVYTDYDTDGITGGAILWETLHLLGFTVFPYVPHRHTEGYGFSTKGIDAVIAKYHPALIVSVDHGISAREQIAYAVGKGVAVVVTDHHTKPPLLPDAAVVIIHCPLVSGSSLAYITALDVWRHFDPQNKELEELFHVDLLALAALGTIADLVPLVGYARSIAKYGLGAFFAAKKPGIQELLKVAGLSHTAISTYHAGFALAPRLNAVGRLSHAIEALRMLCTRDPQKATYLAAQANMFNLTRQKMVEKAVEEALLLVNREQLQPIIVVRNESWNEGIIGLISSKLSEKYNRPSIVLTKSGDTWKGSARSIKGVDITAFLRSLGVLAHVGGHPQAAGFSFVESKLDVFLSLVGEKGRDVPLLEKTLFVDLQLPLNSFTEKAAKMIAQMEPFGVGNPTPLFASNVVVRTVQTLGKEGKHLKLFVNDKNSPSALPFECVYFSPPDEMRNMMRIGQEITIIFSLEMNAWNGREKVQGKIKTISQSTSSNHYENTELLHPSIPSRGE